jgi:hypothetical protein
MAMGVALVACGGEAPVGAGPVSRSLSAPVGQGSAGSTAENQSAQAVWLGAARRNTAELQTASAAAAGHSPNAASIRPKMVGLMPVHRFFNTRTLAHFYTGSEAERASVLANLPQFRYEGVAFEAVPTPVGGMSPVYRFYNLQTGVHFYTISDEERAFVEASLSSLLRYEGVAYYASKTAGAGLFPLYRFYLSDKGHHFYTASGSEAAQVRATLPQYRDEGVSYYLPAASVGPTAPSLSLSVVATSVPYGGSTNLSWTSAQASDCSASGGWTGTRTTSGSASTGVLTANAVFTLVCSGPGGSVAQSVQVTVVGSGGVTGLDFPANQPYAGDVRFRFTGSNLLDPYPATYIWRVNVRQQPGYYTTFFWGPDGPFTAQSYYGAHPYPDGGGSSTLTHKWEVSIEGTDTVTDVNGHNTAIRYGDWHTQALVVRRVNTDEVEASFYWDLPDTTKLIRHTTQYTDYANTFGSRPYSGMALSFGDAPWALGSERLNGILRGIQIYSAQLSLSEVLSEVSAPLSTPTGSSAIWYLNLNPTPTDITDKSGRGHHPTWAGALRPSLWVGP